VSLDTMRAKAVAAAEATLHRKVEIGAMRLQIFSGLGASVEHVVVHNGKGFESPSLLSADRVSVKVAFWPLLSRRLEVRRLAFDGVVLTVERAPSGALNVNDALSAGKRDSAPASQAAAAALSVSTLEIARGRVAFVDRKVAPGTAITVAIDDLSGQVADVGPSRPARFAFAARFLADKARNLSVSGTFGPPPSGAPVGETPLEAEVGAQNVALARLAPYVAAFAASDPGVFNLTGRVSGKLLGSLALSGRIALDPPAGARLPAVDGTFTASLDWGRGSFSLARSVFDVAELPIALEGRVDDLHATPRVDLRAGTPGEVGLDHVTGLPGLAGRFPAGWKLGGRVRVDVQIQGAVSALDVRGAADASELAVSRDGRPMFEAPSFHATVDARGPETLAGRLTAPAGAFDAVPFQNLRADWTWTKAVLMLAPTADVFGGTLTARADTDFSKPKSESRLSLDVRGVQAQPLVEAATSARNVLAGTLDGKISLTSPGFGWDAISKSGRGEGRLSVKDADLRTLQLMPEVAQTLGAVGRVAGFQVPPSLESTKFSMLETSLQLADGRVATPDLVLTGRDITASADGSLGLDKSLAYAGRVVLGPALVKSLGSAGRDLADAQGRVSLPFHASGQITAPRVTIDESVVVELGRRVLAREAGDRLGGAAGKALRDALGGGDTGGKAADPMDVLQRLLKAPAPTPTAPPR
jgi:AsmA protein